MKTTPLVVYRHGLNSSPVSRKAQQTVQYIKRQSVNADVRVPELSTDPLEVVRSLQVITEKASMKQPVYIIGSSLGGYLGTWLHQYLLQLNHGFPVRLVIINPAVLTSNLFEPFLGPQENLYTGEKWHLTQSHIEQLRLLEVNNLIADNTIMLLAQTGDEVLDYRLAEKKYKQCRSIIQQGGDHSFIGYEELLPDIFTFLTNHD